MRKRFAAFAGTVRRIVRCGRCCGNCRHFHAKQDGQQGHCGLACPHYTLVFTLSQRDYCRQWEATPNTSREFQHVRSATARKETRMMNSTHLRRTETWNF